MHTNLKIPALMLLLISLTPPLPASAENILINGGLEEGAGQNITGWRLWSYAQKAVTAVTRETDNPREGAFYVSLSSEGINDLRLIQDIKVEPEANYKISGWLRARNIGTKSIGANISLVNHYYHSTSCQGTSLDWQYTEFYVKTAAYTHSLSLGLSLGGYSNMNSGTASFDDIKVEKVTEIPSGAATFQIPPQIKQKQVENKSSGVKTPEKLTPLLSTLIILTLIFSGLLTFYLVAAKKNQKLPADPRTSDSPPRLLKQKKTDLALFGSPLLLLFIVCLITLPFILDMYNVLKSDPQFGNENHYLYQARAFLEGKISVSRYIHDMAVFKDKYYVIYPPFPALLSLPFVAIWGMKTKVTLICLVLSAASFFLLYNTLKRFKVAEGKIPWVLGAFFFGTGFWFSLSRTTGVAFYAHICSVFACLLCLHEVAGKKRGLLLGLFLGIAFLSRQLTIFMAFFVAAAIWAEQQKSFKQKLQKLILFGSSLGLCVLLYLLFNYARFGNIFDTGYSYLRLAGYMQARVGQSGLFSLRYIPFNFFYLFIQGPHFSFGGEDMLTPTAIDMFGTALTFASPFVFFSLRGKIRQPLLIAAWISIGLMLLLHLMYYNNGWVQLNNQRFSLDYLPLLIILIALGIKDLPGKIWKPAILFAVLLNAYSVWLHLPPPLRELF